MPNLLKSYESLDTVQINGMILAAKQRFPYLECSSQDILLNLCVVMIHTHFILDTKATPIRASFEFLRQIMRTAAGNDPRAAKLEFKERDFIFAIKMFGLKIRDKNGLKQFVPENEIDHRDDEEVLITDEYSARELEHYVSDIQKRTKIQTNGIESALNRLLRDWREIELAKEFTNMMDKEGIAIGQARDRLRDEYGVKDHEFVRIRDHAIELGLLKSKRNQSKNGRRITLDPDVLVFVEQLMSKPDPNRKGARKEPASASEAVNQAMRDFYLMINNRQLSDAVAEMEKAIASSKHPEAA